MIANPKKAERLKTRMLRRAFGILFFGLAAASAGTAAPASATVFHPGEKIGTFKVLGGHVRQQADYLASYETTPSSQFECWTYKYNDQGGAKFDLTFDRGEKSALKYDRGTIEFTDGLSVSGTTVRRWSGTVENQPGPNSGDSSCQPPDPPTASGATCGTKTVKGADSLFFLALAKGGKVFAPGGHDAALYGGFLRDDPLYPCPSDSAYGTLVLPTPSTKGANELDDAKIGEKLKLQGKDQANGPGPDGFTVPFDWVAGSQQARVDWSLKLQRVKQRK